MGELSSPLPDVVRNVRKYDKETMLKILTAPECMIRPDCLAEDFNNEVGLWNPELWIQSVWRSESPVDSSDSSSALSSRRSGAPRELNLRKKSGPYVDRLKPEPQPDIVLSPQRRSFGQGCFVNKQTLNNPRQGTQAVEYSNRRGGGNGRGHGVYRGGGRDVRDGRENWRERSSNSGRFDNRGGYSQQRDYERGAWYRERRDNRCSFDEPEWMTGGPSDMTETIDLHGFDDDVPANAEEKPADSQRKVQEANTVVPVRTASPPKSTSKPKEKRDSVPNDRDSTDFTAPNDFNLPAFASSGASTSQAGGGSSGSRFSKFFAPGEKIAAVEPVVSAPAPSSDQGAVGSSASKSLAKQPSIMELLAKASVAKKPESRPNFVLAPDESAQVTPLTAKSLQEVEASLRKTSSSVAKHESHPILQNLFSSAPRVPTEVPAAPRNAITEQDLLSGTRPRTEPKIDISAVDTQRQQQMQAFVLHQQQEQFRQLLLQQQQQQSQMNTGRVPSPLVFGEQPPHTGTAMPQPVNPAQLAAHTQRIYQQALLNKKMEEQQKKEQERTRLLLQQEASSYSSPATAFTPTSVLRQFAGKARDGDKEVPQQLSRPVVGSKIPEQSGGPVPTGPSGSSAQVVSGPAEAQKLYHAQQARLLAAAAAHAGNFGSAGVPPPAPTHTGTTTHNAHLMNLNPSYQQLVRAHFAQQFAMQQQHHGASADVARQRALLLQQHQQQSALHSKSPVAFGPSYGGPQLHSLPAGAPQPAPISPALLEALQSQPHVAAQGPCSSVQQGVQQPHSYGGQAFTRWFHPEVPKSMPPFGLTTNTATSTPFEQKALNLEEVERMQKQQSASAFGP